jgi:hypothetical protein
MAPKRDKHHSTKKPRIILKLSDKLEIVKKLERGVSRSVLMSVLITLDRQHCMMILSIQKKNF